jgi:hypothetical protein
MKEGLRGIRRTMGEPKTIAAKKGFPIDVYFEDIAKYKVSSKAGEFDKFVNKALMGSRMGKGFKRAPFYSQAQLLKLEAGGKFPTIELEPLTKAVKRATKTVSKTKPKAITAALIGGGGGTVAVQATKAKERKGVYIPALMDFEETLRFAPGFSPAYGTGTAAEQKREQKLKIRAVALLTPIQASKELEKIGVKGAQKSSQRLKDITASLIGNMPIATEKSKIGEKTVPSFMEAQAIGLKTAIFPIELAATKQKIITGLKFDFPSPQVPIPKPKWFLFPFP